MHAATYFDGEGWRDGVLTVDDEGRMLLRAENPSAELPRLDGVVVGGFTDHHVHLQLVDATALADSGLGRVVDLGGDPGVLRELRSKARRAERFVSLRSLNDQEAEQRSLREEPRDETQDRRPTIEFAGAFLTPPGGYPSDRAWAPAGSFREIADEAAAVAAVTEMADAGASCIKVASNRAAGPVFGDALIRAIVAAAGARALGVVMHAEGAGEAERAARLGATTLAHAPFTERLDDDEIAEQAASVSWISTLAIHDGTDRATAVDNVGRFHAAGGTVRYGTDMGNGPTPVDLHPGEIAALHEAGIAGPALLRVLAPCDALDPASVLLLLPHADADPLSARRLAPSDLKV
ncbi:MULTISPECIES: amidohydrolase [unclassified Microbacterium]|uniref:amidohydrolase n=1 Tax=unclassified Microbacterium TaxID=2609290 RepID=UPI000EAA0933|nr:MULTISPECIES: amidohydrolase [unclassified Microbacterium]MBT2483452.1 hydrolase [Microbacterium sp. ISL-108]RKN66477.1 amidohydrolase [Microbacterium sp. CGR2]